MADVTTLWNNQTFTEVSGSWADGTIAISPIINNQNSAYNSLDVTLQYGGYEPDGGYVQVGTVITAVVEERVAGDLWVAIAQQGRVVKGSDNAKNHIIRIRPQSTFDSSAVAITEGPAVVTWISTVEGSLGAETRIRILRAVVDTTRPYHTSLTLTGYAREYDTV